MSSLFEFFQFPSGWCSVCARSFDITCHGCINFPNDVDVKSFYCRSRDLFSEGFVLKNRIKEYRNCFGCSQMELAYICGLSQNTISNYENNIYFPSLIHALLIANAFGVSIDKIFFFDKD